MRTVILNGARKDDPATDTVNELLTKELADVGWNVEPLTLRDARIGYCQGDFECWTKTPGACTAEDDSRDIVRALINSDVAIFLSPVTFGGYSSELKRALDKIVCLDLPFFQKTKGEWRHPGRYGRFPRVIGVGVMPHVDQESERIFTTLVSRNALNLHPPSHAARVIGSDQSAETIRSDIRALFTQAGVQR